MATKTTSGQLPASNSWADSSKPPPKPLKHNQPPNFANQVLVSVVTTAKFHLHQLTYLGTFMHEGPRMMPWSRPFYVRQPGCQGTIRHYSVIFWVSISNVQGEENNKCPFLLFRFIIPSLSRVSVR
jgi:hypothetical protein